MVHEKVDVKFACYIYHIFLCISDLPEPKCQDPFPPQPRQFVPNLCVRDVFRQLFKPF